MEENQTLTNEQLVAELGALRSKATVAKVMTYGSGAVMILMFLVGMIPIAVVMLVPALVGGYMLSKNSSAIKKLLSDSVINSVLKEVLGDAVEYNPWGKINPGSMVVPFSYNSAEGGNHIKAVYNGLNIEIGDIELINETEDTDENGFTQKDRITNFKGQWLTCDFGKELAGEIYISEWTKKDRRIMKSNVSIDNEQFSKRFCVRADNPQEAYDILAPHMMENIITMADKSGGTIYLSFLRGGKMHVAVKSGRNLFEIGKGNIDLESLQQKFLGELRWFTDVVDTLRAEDSLYKKEAKI